MVVMISFKLMMYCLVLGAGYLLVFDLIWSRLEKYIPTLQGFPENLVESKTAAWFISCFIIEFVFFVLMPTVIYDWFYTVLPFYGVRGGLAMALYLFVFGMIPFAVLLLFRIRIPAVFVLYQSAGLLIRIVGCMAIIAYLYSL